jgi:hypothetical protein
MCILIVAEDMYTKVLTTLDKQMSLEVSNAAKNKLHVASIIGR